MMYMSAHTKQENITRLANYRRISLQEAVTPVEDSIPSFLSLVSNVGPYDCCVALDCAHVIVKVFDMASHEQFMIPCFAVARRRSGPSWTTSSPWRAAWSWSTPCRRSP
jgi:hypothetical protein